MIYIPVKRIIKVIELKDYIIVRYHSLLYNKVAYGIADKKGKMIQSGYQSFKVMYYHLLLNRCYDKLFDEDIEELKVKK